MAAEFNLPWLGALPLQLDIRVQTDSGNPSVIAAPEGEAARIYHEIAHKIAVNVAALPRDLSGFAPTVVARKA
jgi:ATP-binding protein involved in chromosome partitioning